jgi:hypothetical protein
MLRMPDDETILALWERAEREHPIERALSILSAFTHESRDVLAAFPVHRRDALLLSSRVATFGTQLEGIANCPNCKCEIDASVTLPATPAIPSEDGGVVSLDGATVSFRVPDSRDLAEALREPDPVGSRKVLLRRCQLSGPSEEAAERLIELELARLCDASSIELSMPCPQCLIEFTVPVDVGQFFWRELAGYAMRLLDDVHALASRYGWAEADILAMSERRRRLYLERYQ